MWNNSISFLSRIYLNSLITVSDNNVSMLAQLISHILSDLFIFYSADSLKIACNYCLLKQLLARYSDLL